MKRGRVNQNCGRPKLRRHFCRIFIERVKKRLNFYLYLFSLWSAGSWIKIIGTVFYIFPSHSHRQLFSGIFFSSLFYPYANVSTILICIAYLRKTARIWKGFAVVQILSFLYWSLEIESTKDQLWPSKVQVLGHLRVSTGLGGVNEEIDTLAKLRVKIFNR